MVAFAIGKGYRYFFVPKCRSPPLLSFSNEMTEEGGCNMAEHKKYIYIKEMKVKVEVSEVIYKEYCRINNHEKYLRKKDQKNGLALYSNLDNNKMLGEEMIVDQNLLDTEEQIELKLQIERLRECLEVLTDAEWELIQALFYENLSERELSKKMNCHHMTIHNQKVRILKKLKKLIEK